MPDTQTLRNVNDPQIVLKFVTAW